MIRWLILAVARRTRADGRAVDRLVQCGVPRDRVEDARDRTYLVSWRVLGPSITFTVVGVLTTGALAPALWPPIQEPLTVIGVGLVVIGALNVVRAGVGSAFARELLIREVLDFVKLIDKMDRDVQKLRRPARFFGLRRQSSWETRNRRVAIVAGARSVAEGRAWFLGQLCARVAGRPAREGRRDPWNRLARVVLWFGEKPHDSQRTDTTLNACAQIINHVYSGELLDPAPIAVCVERLPAMPPLFRARLAPLYMPVMPGVAITVVGGLLLYWLSGTRPG